MRSSLLWGPRRRSDRSCDAGRRGPAPGTGRAGPGRSRRADQHGHRVQVPRCARACSGDRAAAPIGAATLAAAVRLRERGELGPDDRVVLINTGTAYKYPDALELALGTAPPLRSELRRWPPRSGSGNGESWARTIASC